MYPGGRVTTGAAPFPPSVFRSCETYPLTAFTAVGGGDSPHSSSIKRCRGNDLVRVEEQDAEHGPVLQRPKRELSVFRKHDQRPQDPVLHALVLPQG